MVFSHSNRAVTKTIIISFSFFFFLSFFFLRTIWVQNSHIWGSGIVVKAQKEPFLVWKYDREKILGLLETILWIKQCHSSIKQWLCDWWETEGASWDLEGIGWHELKFVGGEVRGGNGHMALDFWPSCVCLQCAGSLHLFYAVLVSKPWVLGMLGKHSTQWVASLTLRLAGVRECHNTALCLVLIIQAWKLQEKKEIYLGLGNCNRLSAPQRLGLYGTFKAKKEDRGDPTSYKERKWQV